MRIRALPLATLVAAPLAFGTACSDDNTPTSPTAAVAPSASSVTISPATDTVEVGKSIQLTATALGRDGSPITGAKIVWGTYDTSLVAVSKGTVTGRKAGTARIVAVYRTSSTMVIGRATVVVRAVPSTGADALAPAAALYASYRTASAHWPHIRTMMTDFYYAWTPTERAWAAAHYDYAMSGNGNAWKAANPTVGHMPYTIEWSVMVPGQNKEGIAVSYYTDMQAWYKAHPSYNIENAFLHVSGSSAPSVSTRLVKRVWDTDRWLINPADPGARAYTIDRYRRITANEAGAFIDEAGSGDMNAAIGGAREFPNKSDYQAPHTSLLRAIKQAIGNKVLMINTATYTKDWDRANIIAAGASHMEAMNNALASDAPSRWKWMEDLLGAGAFIDLVTGYSSNWASSHTSTYPAGNNYATSAQRLKMVELANYYMVVGASPDHLALQLENTWSDPYSKLWLKAQEANIGHPRSARAVYARGTDPTGKAYTVWSREFDRALVLVRMAQGWDEQSFSNATAVTVNLPAGQQWLPLKADGTLGAAVTKVTLRNSEAMILVKKGTL